MSKAIKIKGDKYHIGDEVILTVGDFNQKFKLEKVTDKGSLRFVYGKDDHKYSVYIAKNRDLLIYPQKQGCGLAQMTKEIQRSARSSYRRGASLIVQSKNFKLSKVEGNTMNMKEIKRGMRITFVNGTVVIAKEFSEDGTLITPVTNQVFPKKDCTIKERRGWEVALVEDLDDYGEYYEIYRRKAPREYYFTPKEMTMDYDEVLCIEKSGKWGLTFKGDFTTENTFTLEEFAELGLDANNFDKQLVQVGE